VILLLDHAHLQMNEIVGYIVRDSS
jgi:hypothetical protein